MYRICTEDFSVLNLIGTLVIQFLCISCGVVLLQFYRLTLRQSKSDLSKYSLQGYLISTIDQEPTVIECTPLRSLNLRDQILNLVIGISYHCENVQKKLMAG